MLEYGQLDGQSIAYNDCYAASLALIRSIKVFFDVYID